MLSPDHYHRSVIDIDVEALRSRGIDTLLVDLDNTLLPRDSGELPEEVRAWALRMRREGFGICLVSNNWHARVHAVASEMDVPLVAKALKPLPFAFLRALRLMRSTRRASVVVGDQLFTDVLGAKLLGMASILVVAQSASDLPHTLLLRRLERILLAGRVPVP